MLDKNFFQIIIYTKMNVGELCMDDNMYGYQIMFNGDIIVNRTFDKVEDEMQRVGKIDARKGYLNEMQTIRKEVDDINDMVIPEKSRMLGGKKSSSIFKVKNSYKSKYF